MRSISKKNLKVRREVLTLKYTSNSLRYKEHYGIMLPTLLLCIRFHRIFANCARQEELIICSHLGIIYGGYNLHLNDFEV